jgi:hypothetical protein
MSELEESVARELLAHNGIDVIWQAHVAADAAHRAGNDRAAEILLKIADAAEMVWRDEGPPQVSLFDPLTARLEKGGYLQSADKPPSIKPPETAPG